MQVAERSISKENSLVDISEREPEFEISWSDFKRPERYQGGPLKLAAALSDKSALLKRAGRKWRKTRLQTAIVARALAESRPDESARYLKRAHRRYRSLIHRKGGQPPRKLLDECYYGFLLLAEAASFNGDSENGRDFALAAIECARLSFTRDEREDLIQDIRTRGADGDSILCGESVRAIRGLLEQTEDPDRSKFLMALLPAEDERAPVTEEPSETGMQDSDASPEKGPGSPRDPDDPEVPAAAPENAPRLSWFNRHPCHLPIPQLLGDPETTWIRLKLGRGLLRTGILGLISLIVFALGEILCHVLTENALGALIGRAAIGFLPEAPGTLLPSSISTLMWSHLALIALLLSVPLWWAQNTIRVALASLTFRVEAAKQRLAAILTAGVSTAFVVVGTVLLATQTHTFYTASVLIKSSGVMLPEGPEEQLSALKLAAESHPEKSTNQFDNYLHVLMGLHFERLKAYDDSIAQWGLASRRAYFPMPSRTFVNYEVQVRRRLQKTREFEEAVQENPDDPRLHADFGTYLLCHGRLMGALARLTVSLQLDPKKAGLFSYRTSVPQAVRILEKNTQHIISSDERGVDIAAGFLDAVKDTTVIHRLGWAVKNVEEESPLWAQNRLGKPKELVLVTIYDLCRKHEGHVIAQLNQAEFLNMIHRYYEADKAFEKVEKLGGLDARGYTTWGITLYYLKRYSKAITRFEMAWKRSRRKRFVGNVLYRWGWALARSNRYEEAKQRFEEAIKAEEGERKYFYQYGKALNYMGEYEAAITQLERATEPPFPYRAAYGVWASSLNQLGRSAEAVSLLTKIIRYRKTSSSTYAKTVRQTFQGLDQVAYLQARDSVIHHVKELRTEIASTWLPDLYLAATLAEMGDIEAATGLLYHLELFVPWRDRLGWLTRSSTDYSKWGWAYLAAEKPDLAVLKFRSAILADSENKDAYQGLALAYLKLDKGDRAESSLKALMEIFPNRASNLSDFAEAFERNGQYAKAVEYYAKSIEAGNTSKSTALDAVLAYIQAGETQRGLDLIELLNSKEGSEGRYYRERTRSYLAAGEWERADAAVKTMLTRSRSSSTNRQLAGFFELGRGDYREAEAHFKCSRRNGKRDSVMRVLETLCHTLQQGKFAEPEAVNGRLPWPEMATAFIEGRATEQQLMRQATHLVNDRNRRERLALAHYVIAETLLASGSREKAIYHYREGLAQRQFRSPIHWIAGHRLRLVTVQE